MNIDYKLNNEFSDILRSLSDIGFQFVAEPTKGGFKASAREASIARFRLASDPIDRGISQIFSESRELFEAQGESLEDALTGLAQKFTTATTGDRYLAKPTALGYDLAQYDPANQSIIQRRAPQVELACR